MTMKLVFLGSGSAFTVGASNYQSNLLLQKGDDSLLIDAGGDLRFSLNEQHLTYSDIKNVYISHLHADHVGGLEWLAINTHFDKNYIGKPNLYVSDDIIQDLWDRSLSGGLCTLQTEKATLSTFFNVIPVKHEGGFLWGGAKFRLVQSVHVISNYTLMPCYGLFIYYNDHRIYFTADSQYAPKQLLDYYEEATIIFHDCETSERSTGVHAHYSELATIPAKLKKKMWLYHYNSGKLPDAKADGFQGFVQKGQKFSF